MTWDGVAVSCKLPVIYKYKYKLGNNRLPIFSLIHLHCCTAKLMQMTVTYWRGFPAPAIDNHLRLVGNIYTDHWVNFCSLFFVIWWINIDSWHHLCRSLRWCTPLLINHWFFVLIRWWSGATRSDKVDFNQPIYDRILQTIYFPALLLISSGGWCGGYICGCVFREESLSPLPSFPLLRRDIV